jgi:hypothetical protein
LLKERREAYESAAITVDTDDAGAADVVERVVRAREGKGGAVSRRPQRMPATAMPRTLEVSLGERSYPIVIGMETLSAAGGEIARRTGATGAVVVTEPGIGRRYAGPLLRSLREAGLRARRIDVPSGDATKNLRQAARLYEAFLDRGVDRGTAIVALGGGMVGDLSRWSIPASAERSVSTCPAARTSWAPSTSRSWCGSTPRRCGRSRCDSERRALPR